MSREIGVIAAQGGCKRKRKRLQKEVELGAVGGGGIEKSREIGVTAGFDLSRFISPF